MSKELSAKYYQSNKKTLQNNACERYQSLSKKGKEKRRQYGRKRYKNLPEDEKHKLVEYRKTILKWGKTHYHNYKKLLF